MWKHCPVMHLLQDLPLCKSTVLTLIPFQLTSMWEEKMREELEKTTPLEEVNDIYKEHNVYVACYHEENSGGGAKTVHVVFKSSFCPEACCRKRVGASGVMPIPLPPHYHHPVSQLFRGYFILKTM
jgi:hypothetical protein